MSWNALTDKIASSRKILLSTHKNPDGDGLGSEIAMYYYLKSIDKEVKIVNISSMSSRYKFMDKDNVVESYSSDFNSIFDVSHLSLKFK